MDNRVLRRNTKNYNGLKWTTANNEVCNALRRAAVIYAVSTNYNRLHWCTVGYNKSLWNLANNVGWIVEDYDVLHVDALMGIDMGMALDMV